MLSEGGNFLVIAENVNLFRPLPFGPVNRQNPVFIRNWKQCLRLFYILGLNACRAIYIGSKPRSSWGPRPQMEYALKIALKARGTNDHASVLRDYTHREWLRLPFRKRSYKDVLAGHIFDPIQLERNVPRLRDQQFDSRPRLVIS